MQNHSIPFAPLAPSEVHSVQTVLTYLNSIGFVLALLTLTTHLIFKLTDFPRSMPLWLAFSAILIHIFLLLGPLVGFEQLRDQSVSKNRAFCLIQGVFLKSISGLI
eukprot:TRINITY_DN4864_c0_g4_i4.p1 TRINITY_DN4864_c0_g4~~TRINITY_DN4864_c0_g4_i4.p1  ORF type:complete len:106 (-),score=0.30 TRINITY_DN4864_c0_g4_i4:27-344(-)